MNQNCVNFGELKRKYEALVVRLFQKFQNLKRKMNFNGFLGSGQSDRHNGESRPVFKDREKIFREKPKKSKKNGC